MKKSWIWKRLLVATTSKASAVPCGIPSSGGPLHAFTLKRFYCPEPVKRFYGEVSVVPLREGAGEGNNNKDHPAKWGIKLDSRYLKTPNKNKFEVDNEAVAHAVANEWSVQKTIVMLNSMHMTALANTAIDNPTSLTKSTVCNNIMNWLPLDTILYRSEENERLWELQRELWDPPLQWFQKTFEVKLPIVSGAITPPHIPDETVSILQRELMSYRFDALLGLQYAAEAIKSLILTMGVVKLHLSTNQALRLTRLELDFQTKQWGKMDWAHDIESYDTMSRFACGMMFFTLNTYPPFVCNPPDTLLNHG